jgi:hypothetical protein
MTNAHYFDEDPLVENAVDGAVQDMARRQFGMSLAVGFALLAVAGVTVLRGSHEAPMQATAQHRIIRIEAPQTQMAEPALAAPTKG